MRFPRLRSVVLAAGIAALVSFPSTAAQAAPAPSGPSGNAGPAATGVTSGTTAHATRLARAPQAVAGPTDHYTQNGMTVQPAAVSALPFNFTFTGVSYGIFSRDWVTGSGQACLNMAVTRKSGPGAVYGPYFSASLYANGSYTGRNALFPVDGGWYQYCFTGLKNGVTYKFFLGDGSAANYTFWDGVGNVQNHP